MQHARERVRELTARERLWLPVADVVRELNLVLRGWAGYFRNGNSTRSFDTVRHHAINRLSLVARRHRRTPKRGWQTVVYRRPLSWAFTTSTEPSLPPGRSGGGKSRTPPVKDVGEPARENRMPGSMGRRDESGAHGRMASGADGSRLPDREPSAITVAPHPCMW